MKPIKLKNTSRLDEIPTLGSFITTSFGTDILKFTKYSPDYTPLYLTNLAQERKNIEELIAPSQLTGELKLITGNIYSNQDLVGVLITQLEGYAKRAKGLSTGYKDMGFSKIRVCNNSGDIEGLTTAMNNLLKLTGSTVNMAALTLKGYSEAMQTELIDLKDTLLNDNTAQNKKINDRATLVAENHLAINNYWDKLVDICDAGKRIFTSTSDAKRKQYVMSTVLARMRSDALKTSISGLVEPKSKIEFKPLTTGRKRVVYADKDGYYVLNGITPGDYLGTKITKDKPNMVANVVIVTAEKVVENFGMVR